MLRHFEEGGIKIYKSLSLKLNKDLKQAEKEAEDHIKKINTEIVKQAKEIYEVFIKGRSVSAALKAAFEDIRVRFLFINDGFVQACNGGTSRWPCHNLTSKHELSYTTYTATAPTAKAEGSCFDEGKGPRMEERGQKSPTPRPVRDHLVRRSIEENPENEQQDTGGASIIEPESGAVSSEVELDSIVLEIIDYVVDEAARKMLSPEPSGGPVCITGTKNLPGIENSGADSGPPMKKELDQGSMRDIAPSVTDKPDVGLEEVG